MKKADVYLDTLGKQTKKVSKGEHQIVVEAADKKGLNGLGKVKNK